MLETLIDVDWSNVHTCFGVKKELPDVIRNFASPDPSIYEKAMQWFSDMCFHQQTSCEAVYFAIPFFCELLQVPEVQTRNTILSTFRFITEVASNEELLEQLKNSDNEYNRKYANEIVRQHELIRQNIQIYTALLDDKERSVRNKAATLISLLR